MMPVPISADLKRALPDLALGCVSAHVKVKGHSESLWHDIDRHLAHLKAKHQPDQINTIVSIAAMRRAYRNLGKDPSRYRGSAEALLRRVLSGKGLYQVNTVVDINNLISLESLLPAGSYDMGSLVPPITLRVGHEGESYKGIGKDEINIENLPVFADARGAFGSPTSDSERAMIRLETERLLMVIFSFAGADGLHRWISRAGELLKNYGWAERVEEAIVT